MFSIATKRILMYSAICLQIIRFNHSDLIFRNEQFSNRVICDGRSSVPLSLICTKWIRSYSFPSLIISKRLVEYIAWSVFSP